MNVRWTLKKTLCAYLIVKWTTDTRHCFDDDLSHNLNVMSVRWTLKKTLCLLNYYGTANTRQGEISNFSITTMKQRMYTSFLVLLKWTLKGRRKSYGYGRRMDVETTLSHNKAIETSFSFSAVSSTYIRRYSDFHLTSFECCER